MAKGLFNLKQQLQGLIQKAWYTGNQPLNTWSSYAGSFNGSTQYLNATLPSSLAGQFTIEFWAYETGSTNCFFTLGDSKNANGIEIYTSGSLYACYANNSSYFTAANSTIPSGTWLHLALTRDSSNIIRFFINGVPLFTSTSNTNTFSSSLYIGVEFYNGTISGIKFNGYMSNFRVLNGTCLYTTSFSPPASALTNITNTAILTLQNATIIDNSSNSLTITNTGSVATSTQTIAIGQTITPNSNPTPAVEYLVVAGGGGGNNDSGGGGAGGLIQGITPVTAGSSITVTVGGGGNANASGSNSIFGNITATGGGKAVSYGTTDISLSGGSGGGGPATAGATGLPGAGIVGQGNSGGIGGSVTNRWGGGGGGAGTSGLTGSGTTQGGNGGAGIASSISGTVTTYAGGGGGSGTSAVQASGGVGGGGNGGAFYGSDTPTAGTANTGGGGGSSWNSSSAAGGSGICIISYPDTYNAPSALTGTYTASTSGSGSLSFNGSSQYLTFPNTNSAITLGSNNFTFEGWLYITAYNSLSRVIDWNPNGSSGYSALQMAISSAGAFYVNIGNSAGTAYAWAGNLVGSLPLNTWTHVAIVRNGSTATFYVNGVSTYTNSITGAVYDGGTGNVSYTGRLPSSATYYFTGYMSNLRLVNGTALYTSNFTPPTAPLTPITNTTILLNSVSGAYLADSSVNAIINTNGGGVSWNQLSPFATGLGYKNRVYTWTGNGTVTF